jgi:glycosyltransferase involved in cell wall biosynthesis
MCEPPVSNTILLVGNFLSSSTGTRGVCEDLAERLRSLGWSVVTTSARPRRIPRLLDMLATAWTQRRLYAVAQVDVYSGPSFFWAEAVCWALRRAARPYVLTLHGGNLPAFAGRHRRRVRRLLLSAAAVTAPSRYLLSRMRPYREDIRLVPNPVDVTDFSFHPRNQPRPALIWVRAFHRIYNPDLAVRVLSLLARRFPAARLIMIGPDKGDGSLEQTRQLARGLGLADRITWAGAVQRKLLPAWLRRADILLNTANTDNTPVSVLEAMACGLCVVSTNVAGLPYLLEHDVQALLVPPDNPEAMAAAVGRVLTEPGLAARLSQNARRKAESLDWSVVLRQWQPLLTAAAQGRAV